MPEQDVKAGELNKSEEVLDVYVLRSEDVPLCTFGKVDFLTSMTRMIRSALLVFLIVLPALASDQEDAAADAIAKAFLQARQTGHPSKLKRMGRNTFRKEVCKQDLRLPSGRINNVVYETSDPADLPESARRLATAPDSSKTASRFGIGVCTQNNSPPGQLKYSVLIATYESRWTSFWRIFWE